MELADCHLAMGDYGEAKKLYKAAVRTDAADYTAQTALGAFYYSQKRFAEAADPLQLVANLRPDSAKAQSNLGMVRWALGEMARAEAAFAESLRLRPSRNAYNNRGLFWFYQGKFEASVADFRHALEYAAEDPVIHGHLADALRNLPKYEAVALEIYLEAAELAEKKLKVNKNDPRILVQLARYKAHLGEAVDDILPLIDRALELSPDRADTYYIAALALIVLGDFDGARHNLSRAVELKYRANLILNEPDLIALADNPQIGPVLAKLKP
ncbi:MAG: tetratricopeptide repeat protein [Verrucomicrobiota bacterium]